MGIAERKEREKEKRRNDIIDAAEEIFFHKGIDIATMDEVAERAELSKGTLYLYFKSKEDLQFAICTRGADMLNSMMLKIISDERKGYENLLNIGMATIEFALKHPDHFKTFLHFQSVNLDQVNIERSQYEHYMKEHTPMAIVRDCVRMGMEDGSVRSDIPLEILSTTLWSQMMGVLIVANSKKDLYKMYGVNAHEVFQTHFELVTHGILVEGKSESLRV